MLARFVLKLHMLARFYLGQIILNKIHSYKCKVANAAITLVPEGRSVGF